MENGGIANRVGIALGKKPEETSSRGGGCCGGGGGGGGCCGGGGGVQGIDRNAFTTGGCSEEKSNSSAPSGCCGGGGKEKSEDCNGSSCSSKGGTGCSSAPNVAPFLTSAIGLRSRLPPSLE
jgi:hypothetical protein